MKKLLLLAIGLLFLAGCSQQPNNGQNDLNSATDLNNGTDLNAAAPDSNSIDIDLAQKTIRFNFELDFNAAGIDLNILSSACDLTCLEIDFNSWKVSKDLNSNEFRCNCTTEVCRDEEQPTHIIRYCHDETVVFSFESNAKK